MIDRLASILFLLTLYPSFAQEYTYKIYHNTYNSTGDSVIKREFTGNTETYDAKGEKVESTEQWEYKEQKHVLNFSYRNKSGWSSYFLHPDRVNYERTFSDCENNIYYKFQNQDTVKIQSIRCDEDDEWLYSYCIKGCKYEDSLILHNGAQYWFSIHDGKDTMMSYNRFDQKGRSIKHKIFVKDFSDTLDAFHFIYDDKNHRRFLKTWASNPDTNSAIAHHWDYFDENWHPVRFEEWTMTDEGDSVLSYHTDFEKVKRPKAPEPCKLYVNNSCHDWRVVRGHKNLVNIYMPGYMDKKLFVQATNGSMTKEGDTYYLKPGKGPECKIMVGYIREDGSRMSLYSRSFRIVNWDDY